jgi:Rrf2 family iron-sulfur cluster assembly transcriptional regulator
MLKASTKSTYAIRALIQLGRSGQDKPMRLSTISKNQKIPLPYLAQIFSKLRRSGLVEAVRGPSGGYKLSKNPHNITLADIVYSLEGPQNPVLCSMPENRSDDCREKEGCVSRMICHELEHELNKVLSRNTLGLLCGEADRLQRSHFPVQIEQRGHS